MASMKSNRKRRGLPENIASDTQNFCIPIPTDPQYRAAFFGALLNLGESSRWDLDPTDKRLDVAAWWENYAYNLMLSMMSCDTRIGCRDYSTASTAISFYPCSPYGGDCDLPIGYPNPPFTLVNSNNLSTIIGLYGLGFQVGDVFTDLLHIPSGDWSNLIVTWEYFPRITLNTPAGSGTVKIEFLNIPQGGRALIVVDGFIDVLNLTLIELNRDIVSFPPETVIPLVYEVTLVGEEEHTIEIAFLPTVDDTPIPIFFGGGVRSFELCGFDLESLMSQYCCDETNSLLRVSNETLLKMLKLLQNGFELKPIQQLLSDSLPPVCVPIGYDSDTGDSGVEAQRLGALCYTINAYVEAVMIKAFRKLLMPIDMLLTIIPNFDDMPPQFRDLEVELFAGVTMMGLVAGYSSTDAKELVKCTMQQALQGQINSFDIFRTSVKAENNTDYMTRFLWIMIEQANQSQKNWNLFGQVLNWSFNIPDIENTACPCVVDSCIEADDLVLIADTPDTTVEKLTASTYRVISTYKPMDDPARPDATAAAIKDQYGRCVDFISFTQTQSDGSIIDCSNQYVYSIGGQGGQAKRVGWRLWDGTTIDTVVTIDCVS